MNDNRNNTWKAVCELGNYFSRLGGSARPRNMRESEIQLYVACKILESHVKQFKSEDYIEHGFIEAAHPVLTKTNSYIQMVRLSSAKLIPFLLEFYKHTDEKLKEVDKSKRWQEFGVYLREINISGVL